MKAGLTRMSLSSPHCCLCVFVYTGFYVLLPCQLFTSTHMSSNIFLTFLISPPFLSHTFAWFTRKHKHTHTQCQLTKMNYCESVILFLRVHFSRIFLSQDNTCMCNLFKQENLGCRLQVSVMEEGQMEIERQGNKIGNTSQQNQNQPPPPQKNKP